MKKVFLLFFLLVSKTSAYVFSQVPENDDCTNASLLCPNVYFSSDNISATPQCGGADGPCTINPLCFLVNNSVWFRFITNDIGGQATVSVSNYIGLLDGVLLSSTIPCDPSGYTIIDCSSLDDSLSLSASNLLPNTVYWVMIDGASGNQTNFQIAVFGAAVQWTVSLAKIDATCDNSCDGSATLTPVDGTSPYSYQWSSGGCNTAACTGLCPGSYNVTVSDSINCPAITAFSIGTLAPASIAVTKTPEQCYNACNGTATAVLSSGKTPYSYSWSTIPVQISQTATGLCSDTFSVTVTDSLGCDTNTSVIINTLPPATISFSSTDAQCPCDADSAGSGMATAVLSSGPQPLNYVWSTNPLQTAKTATGLCPGSYAVTVTDSAGCDTSSTVTINVLPPPVTSVTPDIKCGSSCSSSATATLSSTLSPYTYSWINSGQTTKTATGLCPGSYSVIVTDNAGCKDTGMVTITELPELSVSVAKSDAGCGRLGTAIATMTGGTSPYTYQWSNSNTTAFISELAPGNYAVTVTDVNNCTDSAEGIVEVVECAINPAAKFSPNGDGINDVWLIANIENFPDNKVNVYNRWGQLVFMANGYNNDDKVWEGRLVPDAIYFYVIYEDRNNKKDKVLPGNVTILR